LDIKEIKGISYKLYDDSNEFKAFEPNQEIVGNWRKGNEGDWVTTDDGYVVQILKKSLISHPSYKNPRTYVRTICGSYITEQNSHKILGEQGIAENIYAFSGNNDSNKDYKNNRKLKSREFLFARYVAEGNDVISAFKKAFPKAKKKKYIAERTSSLLNKEEIKTMVKEEIKKILEDEGVTPKWIIEKYKDIADISERDSDKLRSLEALSKISGLFETDTKKEQLAVFQGFTPEQLESFNGKETKLVAAGEKESK
tara:strand:+ start:883 stop:1647 length:765 start_codon:yes stop_codon:yes gene_type:complete